MIVYDRPKLQVYVLNKSVSYNIDKSVISEVQADLC